MSRLFIRRRDGRIEVRLREDVRNYLSTCVANVIAAESDPEHEWHASLHLPINPQLDQDNPWSILQRQHDVSSNAELMAASLAEEFLTDAEAWAWLCTLQVGLRAYSTSHGIINDEQWEAAGEEPRAYIEMMQAILFALAGVL